MTEEVKTTTDHNEIRRWILKRNGKPAIVKGTTLEDGILNIDFPGLDLPGYEGEENLKQISWEEFFRIFDEKKLKFLYQEDNHKQNHYFQFIKGTRE